VIEQRLRSLGYRGGHSILREYVHAARPQLKPNRAFLRMEPPAGERFEVDWGTSAHSITPATNGSSTLLLVEAHSRMLYLEFTHSQSFGTFVRCHVHAFTAFGGVAREIAYDNLATAVAEYDGRLVRFLPRFLAFARECGFYPKACNLAAGWEKGKVERAIGYVRQNFWPLREFTDLHDANRQVRQWLSDVANQRQHRETRERPMDRFKADALRPLPVIPYDYRDTVEALVHKDLRLQFDGNRYCVPPRFVDRRLTLKADSSSVTIYNRVQEIVSYPRSWRRGQTLGADRFEAELAESRPAAKRSQAQQRLFAVLDGLCSQAMLEAHLRDIADTDRALSRQLADLLELVRQYGPQPVADAIEKASAARAPSAPITSPTSYTSSNGRDGHSRRQFIHSIFAVAAQLFPRNYALRDPADLPFSNCMHRLVTFDRSTRALHRTEIEARRDPLLDESMILLDDVVHVRRCSATTTPAEFAGLL
jgi:transposase